MQLKIHNESSGNKLENNQGETSVTSAGTPKLQNESIKARMQNSSSSKQRHQQEVGTDLSKVTQNIVMNSDKLLQNHQQ